MNLDTVEIESPRLPGNYSARKINRWLSVNDQSASNNENDNDAIHQNISKFHVSPAQMYSTDSGKLYHAGSIVIVMVGLPGRGKTNLSISLCRYLRWLGVRANLFHLGDYRRLKTDNVPQAYFSLKPDDDNINKIKQNLRTSVINDISDFFKIDNGQIAIYDAINGISHERLELESIFKKQNVKCLFIESIIDNEKLINDNIKDAINSPDYENWSQNDAIDDFKKRIDISVRNYEPLVEKNLTYIKTINFGDKFLINNLKHDFLTTKIIFFLMNTKIKSSSVYFARCSLNKLHFKSDPPLGDSGKSYIHKIYNSLCSNYNSNSLPKDLTVWTSTRLRTTQSAEIFKNSGLIVKNRPELTQLNPGDSELLTPVQLKQKFSNDFEQHKIDPYHHRYPRAESYHDLALKLEPLILEIERMSNDVLIIADETIIRVFYGYLMASNALDIPFMNFKKNEIVKISYHAYGNTATRIKVDGVIDDEN